jgi:hypothetical protein
MLDAVKRSPQGEQRDADRGQRDCEVATDAGPRRPRTRRTACRGLQRPTRSARRWRRPGRSGHERVRAGPSWSPRPYGRPARGRRSAPASRPRAPRAGDSRTSRQDRVGGDSGRVVVGQAGQDGRPDDRQQRRHPARAQQPSPPPNQVPVKMTGPAGQGAGEARCSSARRYGPSPAADCPSPPASTRSAGRTARARRTNAPSADPQTPVDPASLVMAIRRTPTGRPLPWRRPAPRRATGTAPLVMRMR